MMRYLCLEYAEEAQIREIKDEGRLVASVTLGAGAQRPSSQILESADTATTLRVRHGRVSIVDGPFAATREQLVGLHIIEALDLEQAVQIAAAIPTARIGCVEVRPIRQLTGAR